MTVRARRRWQARLATWGLPCLAQSCNANDLGEFFP
jgi:hypothetical protein